MSNSVAHILLSSALFLVPLFRTEYVFCDRGKVNLSFKNIRFCSGYFLGAIPTIVMSLDGTASHTSFNYTVNAGNFTRLSER